MLRKFLDYQLSLTEKGKILYPFRKLISALDTFLYEAPVNTQKAPHIRDAVDLKRWMILVVIALLPTIFMAIWNTGVQSFVYQSANFQLMDEYLDASTSFGKYLNFVAKDSRWATILFIGAKLFLPVVFVSYLVGGLIEAIFATVRGHEIAEGFLVTGILYPLVLPSTIPLWMVAVGVAFGVIIGKELFGGTGMNIMNPALACRAFLFFAFPGRMSGDVWVGGNPHLIRESLSKMNNEAGKSSLDAYTQASPLTHFNVSQDIKNVHVDAIASNNLGDRVGSVDIIKKQLSYFDPNAMIGELTADQMQQFVTLPISQGGLGLPPALYEDAYHFSALKYGIGHLNDGCFFFGNMIGSMGSTSTFACLLGAFFLILTGVAAWRTMVAVGLGAFITASLYEWGSYLFGLDHGAWSPAQFAFPAYKHLLMGGLAFGLVYMATDPVSSPSMKLGQWIYGFLIGAVTIFIRIVNPAFPEGVMLAIIMGNVFAPLIDHYSTKYFRRDYLGQT